MHDEKDFAINDHLNGFYLLKTSFPGLNKIIRLYVKAYWSAIIEIKRIQSINGKQIIRKPHFPNQYNKILKMACQQLIV